MLRDGIGIGLVGWREVMCVINYSEFVGGRESVYGVCVLFEGVLEYFDEVYGVFLK